MELLITPSSKARPALSNSSLFTPKFSSNTTTNLKFQTFTSKPLTTPSLPFYIHFSSTTRVTLSVSAHFGGPTKRRNSLRKKLIDDTQVCQRNSISLKPSTDFDNPVGNFDNVSDCKENLDFDGVKLGSLSELVELDSVNASNLESEKLGESVLLSKLENWVDQYKKDAECWGVGTNHIFTVFTDSEGNAKRVLVNEEEIRSRMQVKEGEFEDLNEVNLKILFAKSLAREMEMRGDMIPRNSSVVKFVALDKKSDFVSSIRSVVLCADFIPAATNVGRLVLYSLVAIWAVKKLFTFGKKEEKLTPLEKEMVRRKLKSRMVNESLEKGSLEVVPMEPLMVSIEKPKLDKQELVKNILEAQASKDKLVPANLSNSPINNDTEFDVKVQTIKEMAREVQEMESGGQSMDVESKEEKLSGKEDSSTRGLVVDVHRKEVQNFPNGIGIADAGEKNLMDEIRLSNSFGEGESDEIDHSDQVLYKRNSVMQESSDSDAECLKDNQKIAKEFTSSSDNLDDESRILNNEPTTKKSRVIRSVESAREFLAKKGDSRNLEPQVNTPMANKQGHKVFNGETNHKMNINGNGVKPITPGSMVDSLPVVDSYEDSTQNEKNYVPAKNENFKDSAAGDVVDDPPNPSNFVNGSKEELSQPTKTEKWIEKNFHEVEPILQKMGEGFKDNYRIAREFVNQQEITGNEMKLLDYTNDDSEFDWMKDDELREIVFQVRDNELSGREPFHLMDAEDKRKFFDGLEKKVEIENKKLAEVHKYLHSNIENLDYGADGISIYDTPEKFIPRWKGAPVEKKPEFLDAFLNQRNAVSARNKDMAYPVNKDEEKSKQYSMNDKATNTSADYALKKNSNNKEPKHSKTVIEGSDGSIRAGKKSGKEFWQHTKKWSHGFLESYNAETDPETKAVMRDIGKDLDRWITEEEIKEAADLMDKLPASNKKFVENKIKKLKREMELFGPQAVVSKYREYGDEKEEDYLWWLDLPNILCIELYITEDGEQRIGFYSLEMAADLELEPKPNHVIAFEDAGDCKNLCYIIQAHMEMLGIGHAFVVPRPPKDAFRDAKANGFSVTVIRKGELRLNIDQTLEEVEEEIAEIGSKIYHDKLMRERSVDINSLMKGVFGDTKQATKRKRAKANPVLKKPKKK